MQHIRFQNILNDPRTNHRILLSWLLEQLLNENKVLRLSLISSIEILRYKENPTFIHNASVEHSIRENLFIKYWLLLTPKQYRSYLH